MKFECGSGAGRYVRRTQFVYSPAVKLNAGEQLIASKTRQMINSAMSANVMTQNKERPKVDTSVTCASEALGTPPAIGDWQQRFKVVKMVSKEPFKRGRWLCMDFNDPPPTDSSVNTTSVVNADSALSTDRPLSCIERASSVGQSGGSTVAIDNKIEQAMDLVKSHLMFAVREEVDVLKEKIEELMEKINQLEYENSILKANASGETLLLLQQPQQQQQQQQQLSNTQTTVVNTSQPLQTQTLPTLENSNNSNAQE
ncbi:TSC22 domain containing protein-like protein [Leptotrombidium deliense]|uniref:TSC22 domain containing protein-like protein n=1 Tax=Leptotrombidium deliense TaxID=299467 RepID=A0A443S8R3_9ACAR|nr:TSC22 domain containing protein-like protein [Leptotrombidium deliense]